MLTALFILALGSLVAGIAAAMGKCPVWVPMILLAIIEVIEHAPR